MIFLYILGFILFLLIMPISVTMDYADQLNVSIRYLFIKINPLKPKKEKKQPKKKEEKETKEKKPNKLTEMIQEKGALNFLKILSEILKIAFNKFYKLLKKIKVNKLEIYFVAGGENASDTALLYGKASGIVYPFVSGLVSVCKCKNYKVLVDADYKSEKPMVNASIKLSIRPLFILGTGFSMLFSVIPFIIKLRKAEN